MKCMSVAAFNLFLAITGLEVKRDDSFIIVQSQIPAYYVYRDEKFCFIGNKEDAGIKS